MTLTKTLTKRLMTVDDLLSAPDDGYRYELIRGELVKRPSSGFEHGVCSANINMSIGAYVKSNRLGETPVAATFLLATDPDHARIPDVAFVSAARLDLIEDRARLSRRARFGGGSHIAHRPPNAGSRKGRGLAGARRPHGHRGEPAQPRSGSTPPAARRACADRSGYDRRRRCTARLADARCGCVRLALRRYEGARSVEE